PAIYVDNDAALLAGRELGGYPKKMAQITMRNYGDLFLSQMSRGPIQKKTEDPNFSDLASSNVTKGSKLFSVPLSADKTAQLPPRTTRCSHSRRRQVNHRTMFCRRWR